MGKRTVPVAIREALIEALRLDSEEVEQAIAWAKQAGYTLADAPGRIIEAAAAIPTRGTRGPKAAIALRAAIFDGAPNSTGIRKSEGAFFRSLRYARAAGIDDATLFSRDKAKTTHEIARGCENWLRTHGRLNGQQGFNGDGWGFDAPQGA